LSRLQRVHIIYLSSFLLILLLFLIGQASWHMVHCFMDIFIDLWNFWASFLAVGCSDNGVEVKEFFKLSFVLQLFSKRSVSNLCIFSHFLILEYVPSWKLALLCLRLTLFYIFFSGSEVTVFIYVIDIFIVYYRLFRLKFGITTGTMNIFLSQISLAQNILRKHLSLVQNRSAFVTWSSTKLPNALIS